MPCDAYLCKQDRGATTRGNFNYRGRHNHRTRGRLELNRPSAVMLRTIRHRTDELALPQFAAQMEQEHARRLNRVGPNGSSRRSQIVVGRKHYRTELFVVKEPHHQQR